jgi:hypothetical protein
MDVFIKKMTKKAYSKRTNAGLKKRMNSEEYRVWIGWFRG